MIFRKHAELEVNMDNIVQSVHQDSVSTSASLGYSLAMIKMFLNYELITEDEHSHIEEIIEKHYANS